MKRNAPLRVALQIALGLAVATALPLQVAHAASNDGSLVGRITASDNTPLADTEVTVKNPETGFSRTVKPDAEGYYRFPFLPVGKYVVEATRNGETLGKLADVTVGLGTATTANVTLAGSTKPVEVSSPRIFKVAAGLSPESPTNAPRKEREPLPVERDLLSV